MATELINVDKKAQDAFYRYKMPATVTKIEGNGNGIKTVFTNIHDVCAKLNRPEEILLKFFGSELGAQATYFKADDKFQVMGSFPQARVQEKVYDFIERFVLCGKCRNPETDIVIGKKDSLNKQCRSCGGSSPISQGEKIHHNVDAHYKALVKPAGSEGAAAAPVQSPDAAAAAAASSAATAAQAQAAVQIETKTRSQQGNPIDKLAAVLTENDDLEHRVRVTFQIKNEFAAAMPKEKHLGDLVFLATIKGKQAWIAALQKNHLFLSRFSDKQEIRETWIGQVLIKCGQSDAPDKFPMALKMLFEEELIQESDIVQWYNTTSLKPSKLAPPEVIVEARRKTEPLVKWLQGDTAVVPPAN